MQADVQVKAFIADGNALRMDFGKVPSKVEMLVNCVAGQTPDKYEWNRHMVGSFSTAFYGVKITGSTGATSIVTTAATGIDVLDEKLDGIWVDAPDGGDDQFRIPENYSTSQDYTSTYTQSQTGETVTATARTSTSAGTLVYPTTRNGFVYELTTATGAGTTEPTWPLNIGETVTDGGSNVWTCRENKVGVNGAKGIKIGATTQTDGHQNIVIVTFGMVNDYTGDVANLANTDYA